MGATYAKTAAPTTAFDPVTPLLVAQHGGKCGTDGFAVPGAAHTFSGCEAVLARIAAALREIPPTASRPAQAVCGAGSEHRRNV